MRHSIVDMQLSLRVCGWMGTPTVRTRSKDGMGPVGILGSRSSSHPPVPTTPVSPPFSFRTREVKLAPTTRARPPRGWGLTAWGAANREELTASGAVNRGESTTRGAVN